MLPLLCVVVDYLHYSNVASDFYSKSWTSAQSACAPFTRANISSITKADKQDYRKHEI